MLIFFGPTSSVPPGSVMLRAPRMSFRFEGVRPYSASLLESNQDRFAQAEHPCARSLQPQVRPERSPNKVGVVVEISIGIPVSRNRSELCLSFLRIANQHGRPSVGMNLRSMQFLLHKSIAKVLEFLIAKWKLRSAPTNPLPSKKMDNPRSILL